MASVEITARPIIKVDGKELSDSDAGALVDLRVSRTTGAAAFAELRFEQDSDLAGAIKVGSTLDLSSFFDNTATPVFGGEIMTVGIDVNLRHSHLVVGAYDKSYRLGNQTNATSHLKTNVGDLIGGIAGDAGLSADVDGKVRTQRFDHIQQTGTPHQFLSDLTRALGCEWLVDDGKLIVRRRAAGAVVATYSGAESLRSFSARFSGAEQAASVDVRGWDPTQKAAVNNKVDSKGKMTGHTVPITSKGVKGQFPGQDVVASPLSVSTADDAKAVATGITQRLESSKLTGRGEVEVNGSLVPGSVIEVEELAPNWNGKYYLTGVEHLFGRDRSFITRFTFGPLEPTTLVDMFSHQPRTSRERLTSGITIGTVTDTKDPEGLLRVKVMIPVLSANNESQWARVVSEGAGDERGSVTIPEVGDEVAVAFENGDVQRPYILGGLWNGKAKAPVFPDRVTNGKIMARTVTSRKSHELVMSDGDGDDDLYVRIQTGDSATKLFLGQSMVELVTDKKPIKISNTKGTIELAENGDISLSGQNITLNAKGDVKISGNNVKIAAKQNLTAEGTAGAELKGSGPVKVQSSAMTEVKGTMVKIN